MKIANSGHILARGNGTSIAGWRWYNDEWSSLTHSEENGSAIDMNNSGTVLGSCAKTGKGWKDTYWSVSIKAATWAANSTTAALSPSATGSAYYNDVLVSEGGAPQDPVDIRQPFGIDDNGAVYFCDVSGNDPYADPPPSSVFTDYAYTLGSGAQSVHKTAPYGWDFPIRIGPVCTAGCVQSAEPDYEYTYDGATLDFTPIDINNDGAVVGDTSIFHGGSTETLPATALAINNRHYPPGDTGASDWQIISDTTLIEKERNDDGSPGANYKSIPITDLIDRASTQTYSGFHLADINDQGAIVATAQKAGATHAVLLVPVEIVQETEQGSGKYQELKAPPIYQPDDGIGAGQVSVTTYDVFNVQFGGTNLTNTAIDTLTVSFSNSSGSFSGLLTETSASSGVFSSSNGAFSVTLNPVSTTTSTTSRTLSASVTASAFGLTNSQRTIQETAVGSGSFVQPQMDCLLTLSAELNSSSPDVISCRIEKGLSYQLTLTETGNDTKVFQTTSGDFTITITNYSNSSDTLNVTISSTYFSGSFSYQLTQMGGGGLVFSNSTTTATNMTPDNPVQTHHGVFYIKIPGTTAKTITLKTDGGDTGNPTEPVEVTLSPSNDLPGYLLSPPLLMVGTAQSAVQNSYTGLTTLQMASINDKLVMAKYGTTDANYTKASAQPFYLGMALPKSDQTDVPPWHYSRLDEAATSMGYAPSKRVDHLVHSDLMSNLKNYSVLYLFCHGDARATPISEDVNFQGIWLWTKGSLWDSLTHKVTAAELAAGNGDHKYNLVFMNACGSANTGSGVAQGYANALHAKNYVGWEFPANTTSAGGAAEQFFRQLKGGHTVSDASKDVTATANFGSGSGGSGTAMNLSFVISDDSVIIDQTPPKAPTP